MEAEVQKGEQVYSADGWAIYATNDEDLQVMEWEDPCACSLAFSLHRVLRGHALNSNCVSTFSANGLLVRRLKLLDITVVVKTARNDTTLTFLGSGGRALSRGEAEHVNGCKPSRVDVMEDVAAHAARSLRAHLAPLGLTDLELHFQFGISPGGETLLQVPNPLMCSFGNTDYEGLCQQLGGKEDSGGNEP